MALVISKDAEVRGLLNERASTRATINRQSKEIADLRKLVQFLEDRSSQVIARSDGLREALEIIIRDQRSQYTGQAIMGTVENTLQLSKP